MSKKLEKSEILEILSKRIPGFNQENFLIDEVVLESIASGMVDPKQFSRDKIEQMQKSVRPIQKSIRQQQISRKS